MTQSKQMVGQTRSLVNVVHAEKPAIHLTAREGRKALSGSATEPEFNVTAFAENALERLSNGDKLFLANARFEYANFALHALCNRALNVSKAVVLRPLVKRL